MHAADMQREETIMIDEIMYITSIEACESSVNIQIELGKENNATIKYMLQWCTST